MTDEDLKAMLAGVFRAQQELNESQKELNEKQQELIEQQKRTDEQLAKTDAQLAKTDAQIEKMSRKLDRLGELVGNISNNQGDIAEEFFYGSFSKNPMLGDIRFDSVSRNLNNRIGDLQDEYDLVLVNGDSLAIIEVKAKAHPKDLERLLKQKLANFPKLFAVYRDYHYYAGIATLATTPGLVEKARELGLFLLTQQGDHAVVVQPGRMVH